LSTIIHEYLESVKNSLPLDAKDKKEFLSELSAHIEDKIQDLKNKGFKDEEAAQNCLKLLGSAKNIARLIYEAHSQGSWQQALMASTPHILFGLIFILNFWKGIGTLLIALIAILTITVYGWWNGKSTWLFTWLGYSLLPVIAAGLSLIYLPRGLDWIAIVIYVPLAAFLIYRVVSQTIKKDWLYVSLMLLPMPAILAWFVVSGWKDGFDIERLISNDSNGQWIGLSFLLLALAVISFVRIRRRWLKIGVLFFAGSTILVLVSSYAQGRLTFIHLLLLVLLQANIFLIPAIIEYRVRTGKAAKVS
jgi:hypothetical protein